MDLREFFNANGPKFLVHSCREIVNQLAYDIYSKADEKTVASEQAKEFLSRGICSKLKPYNPMELLT